MKKVLILEDNRDTLALLTTMVRSVSGDVMIYAVDNVKDAYYSVMESTIDLFIIDIILDTSRPGDVTGLKFVDRIRRIEKYQFTPVLFITALEDHRLHSYEKLHCYDYIEKPFDEKRVREMIRQCLKFQVAPPTPLNIFFQKDGIAYSFRPQEIIYVESSGHTLYIHLSKETVEIPYITLKQVIDETSEYGFVQCSRNTIVNREYIINVDMTNRFIRLKPDNRVEIGEKYKKELKRVLGIIK